MMNKGKIFVIYHLLDEPIISDIYQPIATGNNKDDFSSSFLRDDIGENIAKENSYYNELTAIYWVYKHIDEFKDISYIGFDHYRRLFCFNHLDRTLYVKKNLNKEYIEVNENKLNQIFNDYDMVVPYPNYYRSVRRHYEKSHNKEDINIILDLIKKEKKDFYKIACDYFDSQYEYSYNMFIFKKEDFISYGDFIFPLLSKFVEVKKDVDRLYISERLTGVFISYLLSKNYRALKLPVLHIRKKSLKKSIDSTNDNFKKGKDNGFFYKSKNLLLYLMPRWFEQYLRRRKTK